ncbi:MAG: DUF4238 domain-containing protein, partial [Dechloromonas sp.]|nr:DUF4238 domain-containing protein [Dechloromonas sp.]
MVAVYDRNNNEVRLQQPVNTAVIGHFYTLEDTEGRKRFELEAVLCEYEGKAKPAIAKLIACEGLSDQERSDLSIFIALAAMRTPDMVNSVQSLNGQIPGELACAGAGTGTKTVAAQAQAGMRLGEDAAIHSRRTALQCHRGQSLRRRNRPACV